MSEWSVVTNTKKIKYLAKKEAQREVEQASFQRAEREKANARSFSSSVFDVEVEKKPSTSKKNKYSYSNLSFDLEETQKKKSKKPKKKTSSVQISNSNQLADVLLDILKNHNQDSMSLGKLSDKLQKLTGSTWKAKFKKRYGTILAFTKSREEFRVKDNEDVYMAEDADFSSGTFVTRKQVQSSMGRRRQSL